MSPAADQPFVHRLRVRYVEVDMQGHVFNAHYYTWMDVAHTEWVRSRLGTFSALFDLGIDVVVAESSARFLGSARFDEEVDVEVRLEHLGTTSMITTYTFRRGEDLLAEGRVRHVCVGTVDAPPYVKTPWPDSARRAFDPSPG